MAWTAWRKIAEGSDRQAPAGVGHDEPATYELATRRVSGGDMTIVYVGDTDDQRVRVLEYVRGSTPLETRIADALAQGRALYQRATPQPTAVHAREFRDVLLGKYGYPWNAS